MDSSETTYIIQVTNVAPAASLDQMKELFGYLGKIKDIKLYPSESYLLEPQSRVCYIQYNEAWSVGVAQHLTNTVFIDRALIVVPIVDDVIPDESKALSLIDSSLQGFSSGLSPVINEISGVDGSLVITTIDPRLTALGLPQYPPLPANMDPSKIEEIRRTVTFGNLPSNMAADKLLNFVNQIGEVKYLRMAGDDSQPNRVAFVEFTDQTSVANALQYNGITYETTPLKVNHASSAIIKPQPKSLETAQKEIDEAMKRVKEAQSLITAVIEPELEKEKRKHRSRSRSTSRHRSGSRSRHRRRSRSRSKRRSRSRRRSRSSHRSRRRSRSDSRRKSKKEKSKSRSRERKKSRSPHKRRVKSRSRSRDRKKRHRTKSRSRSRSRSPKRSSKSSRSSKDASKSEKKRSHDKSSSKESSLKPEILEEKKDDQPKVVENSIIPEPSPIMEPVIPGLGDLPFESLNGTAEENIFVVQSQTNESDQMSLSASMEGFSIQMPPSSIPLVTNDFMSLEMETRTLNVIDVEMKASHPKSPAVRSRSHSRSPRASRSPSDRSNSSLKSKSKSSKKRDTRSTSKHRSISPAARKSETPDKKRRSRSRSKKRSPSKSKKRSRSRSAKRSRSPSKKRSRSRSKHRSRSPRKTYKKKSRSPIPRRRRSPSLGRRRRSRSGTRSQRRISPLPRQSKRRSISPRRYSRSPKRYSITPRRRSRSPRKLSRSPKRRSRSPSFRKTRRVLSRSPVRRRGSRRSTPPRRSRSPKRRSRSRSPKLDSGLRRRKSSSRERDYKKKENSDSDRESTKDTKVFRNYDEEEKGYDSNQDQDNRTGDQKLPIIGPAFTSGKAASSSDSDAGKMDISSD